MAIEWNSLQIPQSLKQTQGRPIISKLTQKWNIQRSAYLKHVIHYLKVVQGLSLRDPSQNKQILNDYCSKLIVLYAGVMDWKRRRPLEITNMEVEAEADRLQVDLESVMNELIGNSLKYLNPGHIAKDTTKMDKHKELSVQTRGRMRNALSRFQGENADITMKPANGWIALSKLAKTADAGAGLVKPGFENAPLVVGAAAATAPPVLAGAAITRGGVKNALAARSAYRTHKHLVSLEKMRSDALHKYPSTTNESGKGLPCRPLVGVKYVDINEHDEVRNDVLCYLIEQKRKKRFNKSLAAIPTIGMLTTAKSIASAAISAERMLRGGMGSKPNLRLAAAKKLTDHFFTHNCPLAQDILSEIFSGEAKMEWLKWQEYEVVIGLIMMKFKSK